MSIDWSLSNEELANLIVALPDGTDLGMHPMANLLVGRDGAPRDPERYARIFALASEKARSEWMRIACRIQDYNGTRRTGGANMKGLAAGLRVLVSDILRLPAGPHQCMLGGELAYHQGIVQRGFRDYRAASRVQLASSAWLSAAGQHDKARTALFVAEVEEMSAAFVDGNMTTIAQAFHHMRQMREVVRLTCDPYPRWMQENAAIHIWWAHLMAKMLGIKIEYPEPENDSVEVDETLFRHWKLVHDVVNEWGYGGDISSRADDALRELSDFPSSSIGNAVLTIKLLKAEYYLIKGRPEDARPILEEVASWDGPDGGVPIAVAKALLARMA